MALSYVTALRNNQLAQITTLIDAHASLPGKLKIYDNTAARPASANDAVPGTSVLLAELTFSDPALPAPSSGTVTTTTITQDSSANANGTALWFRVVQGDNTTAVMDGSVGTSGSDLNLNSVVITAGGTVSVTSFAITAGNA